jgi:hypothetical protein
LKERRQEQKDRKKNTLSSSDQKKNQDMKREIRKNSINPGEEMMRYFYNDVESELTKHEEKMDINPNLSSMVPIPLPNYLRKQPEYPYQRKDNIRGGVKKRRTKKGKNKKSKKQKVKRRTNKKRTNKKRKTRRR